MYISTFVAPCYEQNARWPNIASTRPAYSCVVCIYCTGQFDLEPKHPTKTHSQATLLHILSFPPPKKNKLTNISSAHKEPPNYATKQSYFSRDSHVLELHGWKCKFAFRIYLKNYFAHLFEHWQSWWIPLMAKKRTKKTLFHRGDFQYGFRDCVLELLRRITQLWYQWLAGILNNTPHPPLLISLCHSSMTMPTYAWLISLCHFLIAMPVHGHCTSFPSRQCSILTL